MAIALRDAKLTDKYELEDGLAYMSGLQALVRIPMAQKQRDIAAGLNTAGFISGYRGSPLGGYDMELTRAKKYLDAQDIKFLPGVNEDMAATAVWGTQQTHLIPGTNSNYDGVFGMWYGKAPGVDRSGDVIRHASAYGTAPHGGVLAIVGDDHGCKSSTLPCQSDHVLYAYMVPQLYPASILEFVEYGLLGIAMSRYSGCWTAFKVTSETVETSGTIDLSRENREIIIPGPDDFEMPPGGLNIRLNDTPRDVDWRLQNYKLFACHTFARKNNIDRIVMDSEKPRFGIITAGKSYGDVRQALIELGITDDVAKKIGLRLYKVGMTWPLEPRGVQEFVEGLEEILIVEEKRELIEYQLKQQIFNWGAKRRPVVVGKYDQIGDRLLPLHNDQTVGQVAHVIAKRIQHFYDSEQVQKALRFYSDYEEEMKSYTPPSLRKPYYCAGCPHNTSTKVPDDSFAMVGIGCHYMVQWMDRNSSLCTQMGGEGVPWIGSAPYVDRKHIFANLGDGTYFHSGTLAIRAAVAAKVNITYKILYNDAVAMTGGQLVDGEMPVYRVAQQVMAEGVKKCWILSEQPENYKGGKEIPHNVPVLHRDWLDKIMKEARETEGTTIIIYDQTCAAEKRRRRKRGLYPDPPKRVMINKSVCEGCGDCSEQSNCMAVQPVETEYGRKRKVNQSMCNKDFSCLKGFCPSFVTVHGGELRKTKSDSADDIFAELPEVKPQKLDGAYNIMVSGIGGTGVLTVGSLMGMASHLEEKFSRNLDAVGLAQKGGEVLSHVRISPNQKELRTGHIITGGSDLLLACDMVAAIGKNAYETLNPNRTKAVINTNNTPVADFITNNSVDFHDAQIRSKITERTLKGEQYFVPGTHYATVLLGNEIATNIFMVGFAWQHGLIPLHIESIHRAIELNGVAIDMNKRAFNFGRLAAHDPEKIAQMVNDIAGEKPDDNISETLDEIIQKRAEYLIAYQNKSYAQKYVDMVQKVRITESGLVANSTILTEAVARYYHKLLAYKDEYEVARLFTNGEFMKDVRNTFTGKYKLEFNLAPPIFSREDPATGRPKKRQYGAWMFHGFKLLAKMKSLRGTPLDIFGYTQERKTERALIKQYEQSIYKVLDILTAQNIGTCQMLLSLPAEIKGFGPVKEKNIELTRKKEEYILARLKNPEPIVQAAE